MRMHMFKMLMINTSKNSARCLQRATMSRQDCRRRNRVDEIVSHGVFVLFVCLCVLAFTNVLCMQHIPHLACDQHDLLSYRVVLRHEPFDQVRVSVRVELARADLPPCRNVVRFVRARSQTIQYRQCNVVRSRTFSSGQ